MTCHQHTQKSPWLPSGLQRLCSYGPTTTQQQVHNRNSCRFYKILVVMVLQPLNSKLTIELLQVLQIAFNAHTHTHTSSKFSQFTLKTKSCIMLSQNIMYSKYNRDNAFYQLHSHYTRHQMIQVLTDSGTLVNKWGGERKKAIFYLFYKFFYL